MEMVYPCLSMSIHVYPFSEIEKIVNGVICHLSVREASEKIGGSETGECFEFLGDSHRESNVFDVSGDGCGSWTSGSHWKAGQVRTGLEEFLL